MLTYTRDGRAVEILRVLPIGRELAGGDAIIGIITDHDGLRSVEQWPRDGRFLRSRKTGRDLVIHEDFAAVRPLHSPEAA